MKPIHINVKTANFFNIEKIEIAFQALITTNGPMIAIVTIRGIVNCGDKLPVEFRYVKNAKVAAINRPQQNPRIRFDGRCLR